MASLSKQIRLSGRAYPLFEVAGLVAQKPERYEVSLRTIPDKDGQPLAPMLVCSLDESVWVSEAAAIRHLVSAHFDTFYSTEKVAAEPPKGTYTLVSNAESPANSSARRTCRVLKTNSAKRTPNASVACRSTSTNLA